MPAVLILDAEQRSALAATRSLGRRGVRIITADSRMPTLSGRSRYCRSTAVYPDATLHPDAFVEALSGIVRTHGADIVLPMTDVSTMLLAPRAELLAGAKLACPPAEAYESVTDKAALVRLAQRLNVPVPHTVFCSSPSEIQSAARDLGFPVVLKPQRSKLLHAGAIETTEVRIARSQKDLDQIVTSAAWLRHMACLVQQFIPGNGAGVFAICVADGPIIWFSHRRVREKPPWGGVSVVSQSSAIPPLLRQYSSTLLSAVGWRGVAMVEYRVTPEGEAYLMEINGRFWGSLQLAIDSGVDFPWLLYQSVCGKDVDADHGYRLGRRLRWFLGDLDSLIIKLRAGSASSGERTRALWEFVRDTCDPRIRSEIFRLSDPLPAAYECAQWLSKSFFK
jgi:predicted ATP-grasp superfamily ATP-dependent carboligase